MRRLLAFLSRISVRILAFNFLIAFLPIAGMLSLGTYERQLLQSLEHALVQQGRVLAAALSGSRGTKLYKNAEHIIESLQKRLEARIRIVDDAGSLLVDSSRLPSPEPEAGTEEQAASDSWTREEQIVEPEKSAQESWLYRLASFPVRIYRKFRPPQASLESTDYYSGAKTLLGPEVKAALEGRYGAATRVSTEGQRSVTLYSAVPIYDGDPVVGVVLVSQSTHRILWDLYTLRLDIFTLFLVSVGVAMGVSLLVSSTITVPLRKLRREAGLILDGSGRLRGRLTPTRRRDEIGDLSRRFADLTTSLETQLSTAESFASNLSHEMKNSLASIRTATELLAEAPEREDLVGFILDDVDRMERLLADVRELSRLEAGLPADREASSRPVLITEGIVEAMRRRGDGDGVTIRVEGDSRDAAVPPELLQRVIENLLDNAVSFSPRGGQVTVSVSNKGERVSLSVLDQGPGIPVENRERIFERFYTSRPQQGDEGRRHAGLGLAIVKAIAEGYGGSVRAGAARSGECRDGTGPGALVEVELPAAGPTPRSSP